MSTWNKNVFGPGFVPGMVHEDRLSAIQALKRRQSDLPARALADRLGERPPNTDKPNVLGTSTWTAL